MKKLVSLFLSICICMMVFFSVGIAEGTIVPIKSIKLESPNISLMLGASDESAQGQINLKVTPENTTVKSFVFSSSDEAVVTVDQEGKLQAVGLGKAKITVAPAEEKPKAKAICNITVIQAVNEIKMSDDELIIGKGKTQKTKVTISPDNATKKTLSWTSSNDAVASVSKDGTIKAKSCGECDIVCTSTDGSNVSAKCHVIVKQFVASIKLSESKIVLASGSKTITSTITPKDATCKDLIWKSSNEQVATVENGKITAVSGGDCIITCASTDGSEKQATVSVHVPTFSVSKKEYTITSRNTLYVPIDVNGNQSLSISYNSSCFDARLVGNEIRVHPQRTGTGTIKIYNANSKLDDVTIKIKVDQAFMYMSDRELIEMAKGYFYLRGGSEYGITGTTIEHSGNVSYVYIAYNFHCYIVKVDRRTGRGLGMTKAF